MDLGPHAVFIWLCYATVAIVVAAMIITLWLDGRRYRRELKALESSGSERSSGSA
jgi:heme exporter protein CcmD